MFREIKMVEQFFADYDGRYRLVTCVDGIPKSAWGWVNGTAYFSGLPMNEKAIKDLTGWLKAKRKSGEVRVL